MAKKKRVFAKQETATEDSAAPLMQSQSDDVKSAERLVDELLGSMKIPAIANGCGVNYITINRIAKGDSRRISKKVLRALIAFHTRFKSGELPAPAEMKRRGRKPKVAMVEFVAPAREREIELLLTPTPAPHNLINTETIQVEIDKLERRLAVLRQMLDLARQL